MALRKIVVQGDECLTKKCRVVTDFNARLHTLLDDMAETLVDSGGVGLAAPQVGVLRRVCVVMNDDDEIIELINPEIIATEGEQTEDDGTDNGPQDGFIVTFGRVCADYISTEVLILSFKHKVTPFTR